MDPDRYPADFAALVRYGNALRRLPPAAGPRPRPGSLSLDQVLARFPS